MFITSPDLAAEPGIRHAFFTREGGVSTGIYASLNGGLGSADDPVAITENRRRMAAHLQVEPSHLVNIHQVHSADAEIVSGPWPGERPKADAMVAVAKGVALGISTADCGPILFADSEARVIGAAHAGWKGAFTGIVGATVTAMEKLGARRERILAVLGPTIGPKAYEVGPEFIERFKQENATYARFFHASERPAHAMFDLPAFIALRAQEAGIGRFVDLALCTYSDEQRFYSYRRTTHRTEPDYGRLISAIVLS
ncbi:peptidoglycan editing factor PgeF [Bosea caraganae]|uniref:Purine nucleoside phosphorylase n=1 Tax=Bosea caraganae TaxID=2763117 RepID=A0A370L6A3_9HYPH|nr:peptidoglycan editing factor PgeF [Bosea caraganae]RDJ25290.1 peptidoglycan editing factor PgeF [Bosea caraganae]RDJ25927.1 peptidoglycan editing factor PgeF [Bosea caraganae]